MKTHSLVIFAFWGALSISTAVYSQTTYNIYFGDNHSHTWYSDGGSDQTPLSSYPLPVANGITWAKNHRSSFDFLGISDHNHNESTNMTLARWHSGVREADSVNQDGNFVGMYGQEFGTLSTGGHVLVYGTTKLFGWNPGVYDVFVNKGAYDTLWDSVRAYGGYCYLAHPNSSDFKSLSSSAYSAKADSVIRGVAVKSGNASSTDTTETDPSSSAYSSYYNTLLSKGYHVAPIGNQDNHYTTFGRSNQQRTGLLTRSLTKTNVDDAFKSRRVYATEDHNLQIRFEVGTHQMGEIFSMTGSISFRIKISDPDGESISKIELRYGVPGSGSTPTVLTSVTNKDSLIYTRTQTTGSTWYYYVYVQEADAHEAWSAPMWITIVSSSIPGSFDLLSPFNASTNQATSGTLSWLPSTNATGYDVYLGTTNPPATKVSTAQPGTSYSYSGLSSNTTYYWKVVAKNSTDSTTSTGSPWSFTTIVASPAAFSMTSPTNGATDQPVTGTLTWATSANATGYDVYLGTSNPPIIKVSSNQTGTTYSFSGLLNNTVYYWKIVARNANDTIVATGAPWSFTTINSAEPAITVTGVLTDFGSVNVGDSSNEQSYLVAGVNLSANITITAPAGFQVSTMSGSGFGPTLVLTQSGGTVSTTTIYVRFVPVTGGTINGNITNASIGALTENVTVIGTGNQVTIQYDVISRWNFEGITLSSTASATPSLTAGSTQADSGALIVSSQFSGLHTNSSTIWSTTTGNGSLKALSANYWTTTGTPSDYFQFKFSTTGYEKIMVTWDQTGSSTGPRDFRVQYGNDGTNFTNATGTNSTYQVILNGSPNPAWNSTTRSSVYEISLDLSSVSTLDNKSSVYIRIIQNSTTSISGSTVGTSGTDRIDNFTVRAVALEAPAGFALSSPASGATNQSIAGMLSWAPSTNATGYDVYLGMINPPTTKVSSGQIGTLYNYSNLSYGTTYYWKVVAKNGSADTVIATGSPWSFTTIIAPPTAFSMTSPTNGVTVQSVSGTLTWATSANAMGYDVYFGTINPPIIKVSSNQSGTAYNYDNLINNALYYWKVVARNMNDTIVATGSPWHFTTVQASPTAFVLSFPANGKTDQAISGVLRWASSSNAAGYDVYLDSNNPPTTKISSNQLDTVYNFAGLFYDTQYYWKVVAKNGSSDSMVATGSPWSFTTIIAPPTEFSMMSPANGVTGQQVSGIFVWAPSLNASGYDVYVGTTDPPANRVSSNQSDTIYNYSGLLNNTVYYWMVVARNVNDTIVATGGPWSFTTIRESPASLSLVSPPNETAHQLITGTLTWSTSTNATGYDVYLGTINPPVTKVSSNQGDTTYNYTNLLYNTVYYWSVVAKKDLDSVAAADSPWSFKTMISLPASFSLLSPANGSTGQPVSATLRWATSANATVYDIYLGTTNPPVTKVDSDYADTAYTYSDLIPDSTYFWMVVSKNERGRDTAVSAPWNFRIAPLPHGPSSVMISDHSFSSLEIQWIDNATNESGYRVYRSVDEEGSFSQVGSDLESNTTVFKDSILEINRRFFYHITPFNESGEGPFGSIAVTTFANIPDMPVLSDVQSHSLTVTVIPSDNPDATQYAIMATNTTTEYIQADGSLGSEPVWETYLEWGGSDGLSVSGFDPCQKYTFRVKAKNLEGIETSFGDTSTAVMLCDETYLSVTDGWNLLSVPVSVRDNKTSTLFPTAQSSAFGFNGSYSIADSLAPGVGYWVKFSVGEDIRMIGDYKARDTVTLVKGWNIIGSISMPVDIRAISTDPPGIIISNFYAYMNGYIASDTIYPGFGYWVKSSSDGKLILPSAFALLGKASSSLPADEKIGSIQFRTETGATQTLHITDASQIANDKCVLPPLSPEGSFDVRFSSQKSMETISPDEQYHKYSITLQSREPVNVSAVFPQSLRAYVRVGNNDQLHLLSQAPTITLDPDVHTLTLILINGALAQRPSDYSLCQNYPNPFNPYTTINYQLPVQDAVTLKVYNMIGEEVATLVAGIQDAGYRSVQFNASALSSGIYTYRLTAGLYTEIRKMILIK
jgi:hypothetical protein